MEFLTSAWSSIQHCCHLEGESTNETVLSRSLWLFLSLPLSVTLSKPIVMTERANKTEILKVLRIGLGERENLNHIKSPSFSMDGLLTFAFTKDLHILFNSKSVLRSFGASHPGTRDEKTEQQLVQTMTH